MRRISLKNKILFLIFCIIILVIVWLLFYSINFAKNKNKFSYEVTSDMVIFSDDYKVIDTTIGGKIEKKWNNDFYYQSNDGKSILLGVDSVIYNNKEKNITLLGEKFQVLEDGSVLENDDVLEISDSSKTSFYKLADRDYLIVSKDIYSKDKSIYASKYVEVLLDKQGNASLLNDAINLKTINPLVLEFGNMRFDIANEKLYIKDLKVDLKQIIGSTNNYDPNKTIEEVEIDTEELLESYNDLVDDFSQYAKNHNYTVSASNNVENNNVIINNPGTSGGTNNYASSNNKTDVIKYVSMRGAVSSSSYIDVNYMITDPENRYQVVYLLVTGLIDEERITEKIILDKYDTKTRIRGLTPNSEYTISLGYIETIVEGGERSFVDNIEDVINLRTTKVAYSLNIDKISLGKVYFTIKMSSSYAFESADAILYIDGILRDTMPIDCSKLVTDGFSSSFELDNGNVFEIRVENGVYSSKNVSLTFSKKFVL